MTTRAADPVSLSFELEKSNHLETLREQAEKEAADEVKHIVLSNEADLSDVEVTVIHHRFGLEARFTRLGVADRQTAARFQQSIGVRSN